MNDNELRLNGRTLAEWVERMREAHPKAYVNFEQGIWGFQNGHARPATDYWKHMNKRDELHLLGWDMARRYAKTPNGCKLSDASCGRVARKSEDSVARMKRSLERRVRRGQRVASAAIGCGVHLPEDAASGPEEQGAHDRRVEQRVHWPGE